MKKMMMTGLILMVTFISIHAQGVTKSFLDRPYIEVIGEAEMEVVPDQIYMSIVINEKDNKGKTVLAQAEKNMITTLKEIGIDTKKDLSVSDMQSNFRNYWIKSSEVMTTKDYQLIVGDAQTAGKVMKGLERCGISNVSIAKVSHSKIEQFKLEVKMKAIKKAKDKATELAKAIGQTADKALLIEEVEFNNYLEGRLAGINIRNTSMKAVEDAEEPDIEFQKIKLTSRINAKFELN
jgi:uncharacterized protein